MRLEMADIHCPYCDRDFEIPELEEIKMLKTEVIKGWENTVEELPYRVDWGNLKGAGDTPAGAMLAALRIGKYIPFNTQDRKEAARYIFWNYQSLTPWAKIIHILDTNSFQMEVI